MCATTTPSTGTSGSRPPRLSRLSSPSRSCGIRWIGGAPSGLTVCARDGCSPRMRSTRAPPHRTSGSSSAWSSSGSPAFWMCSTGASWDRRRGRSTSSGASSDSRTTLCSRCAWQASSSTRRSCAYPPQNVGEYESVDASYDPALEERLARAEHRALQRFYSDWLEPSPAGATPEQACQR